MIRTSYSFKTAVGSADEAVSRLKEAGHRYAPIADRLSTFGYTKWRKAANKADLIPIFGVEIAVVPELGAKKSIPDFWRFLALDSLKPLHELILKATRNPGKEPSLVYEQALAAPGVVKVTGERTLLARIADPKTPDLYFGLYPSTPKGLARDAHDKGFRFFASSDNYYPREEDLEFYRVALGRRASTQTYPMHILSDREWHEATEYLADEQTRQSALDNRDTVFNRCRVRIVPSTPLVPERPKTLRAMCEDGATRLGISLEDETYAKRLDRELSVIEAKGFEDYFYIVADMVTWAKQRLVVGPGRGSSGGSLVCFLLGITTVDPIPFGLLFERFIDLTRSDLPDIDIDFDDTWRHLVFEYAEKKYGKDRVARLGTVGMFQPRSALVQAGTSLHIPRWKTEKIYDSIIDRSAGDKRASMCLLDTLNDTDAGKKLVEEHPEIKIAARMEGMPHNAGQHAAGIIITNEPIVNYVAIDARTGATMCDKKDAEDMGLLKIDALGLTQLSVFSRALDLIGVKSGKNEFLSDLRLDDPRAYEVLNKGLFSGLFQFSGAALRSLTKQVKVTCFDDLVALTALARPGPMANAKSWVARKNRQEDVAYAHPLLEPILRDTLGIIIFQEQVMQIAREIGGMSWEDVTALRRAMGKSLGKEAFDKYGERWKTGAIAKGFSALIADQVWNDMVTHGEYGFNKCLCGTTKVKLSRTNNLEATTLAELYDKYVTNASEWMTKTKASPWLVSLMPDGVGVQQRSVQIIKSGKKRCVELTFDDGSSVVCTKEHRFLINDRWAPCGSASAGDRFVSLVDWETPYVPVGDLGRGHAKGRKWKLAGGNDRTGKNNVSWKNGVVKYFSEFKFDKQGSPCELCGDTNPRMEAHHLDFCGGKLRPKDLQWLCVSCHKKTHYDNGRKKLWAHGKQKSAKTLMSMKDAGERETYDVEMPEHHNFMLDNGLVTHNSHAVVYSINSYQTTWFKAHHPLEFAAATLDAEDLPAKQIAILRELRMEGIDYVAVDVNKSTDRWTPTIGEDDKPLLVGPLTAIKGIGPSTVRDIMDSRMTGKPVRDTLAKKLEAAKTEIDSLTPIADAVAKLDLTGLGIASMPTPVIDVQCGVTETVVIFALAKKVSIKDENDAQSVSRRGREYPPPHTKAVNMFFADDTDEIFCKINRFSFDTMGQDVLSRTKVGKSLWAIKGVCPRGFRMIDVKDIRYLGEME